MRVVVVILYSGKLVLVPFVCNQKKKQGYRWLLWQLGCCCNGSLAPWKPMDTLGNGVGGPSQSKLEWLPRRFSEGKLPTFRSKLKPVGDFVVSYKSIQKVDRNAK